MIDVERPAAGRWLVLYSGDSSLRFVVMDEHRSADPATTAFVRLRGPGVAEETGCAWPLGERDCTVEIPGPAHGMWEIVYEGKDADARARLSVVLSR